MSVVVVGANHRTAPLDLLEQMTVDADRLPKLLDALGSAEHISEAVVLSTCNRTEVYLVAERFHGAYDEVRDFFSDLTFLPPERFADSLYVHYDGEAVRHLFDVAAGLDSAVPGEHEVLGQVRNAWDVARTEGASGRHLNLLFRHSLEVGKRARSETSIAQRVTSVSQAAVVLAAEQLGDLTGRNAVLVGAGGMGRAVAGFLLDAGVATLTIANRSPEGAAELVAAVGAEGGGERCVTVPLAEVEQRLHGADLVVTATGASEALLGVPAVAAAVEGRGEDLVLVDIGVPRDIDPAVASIDGVRLLDMACVSALTDASLAERHREVAAVRAIVDVEVERFVAIATAREVDPVVRALRERVEAVRSAELERLAGRFVDLDEQQVRAVDEITRAVVAKLLHEPTLRLKAAAGSSLGDRLAESVRDLFDLADPDAGSAPEHPDPAPTTD
ncbi:MAG: glutamyl-tRNA reductase [Microthrixaceae bacterium]